MYDPDDCTRTDADGATDEVADDARQSDEEQPSPPPEATSGVIDAGLSDVALPVLPIRDLVVFPHMVVPLIVVRQGSIRALQDAKMRGCPVLLLTQRDGDVDDPGSGELHEVGTISRTLSLLELPDSTVRVVIEGNQRARAREFEQDEPFFRAYVELLPEVEDSGPEVEAMIRTTVPLQRGSQTRSERFPALGC